MVEVACNNLSGYIYLIHCAGDFWYHKSIINTDIEETKNMIQSHYLSLFNVIKTMIPIMMRAGGGKILTFSCNSVSYLYPEMAAFTSAKAAIECLVKCTANENSKYSIVANCLALSTTLTEKVKLSKDQKYHSDYITINELVDVIKETLNLSPLINGNILKVLKYRASISMKKATIKEIE